MNNTGLLVRFESEVAGQALMDYNEDSAISKSIAHGLVFNDSRSL